MDRDNGPPNDENGFSILISLTCCDSSFKNQNEIILAGNNVDCHSAALSCLLVHVPGSLGLEITYSYLATITCCLLRTFYRLTRILQLAEETLEFSTNSVSPDSSGDRAVRTAER